MSYITQSELETAYGANEIATLADRDADGLADGDVVTAAIERATGVVDGYLRSRFTLPLTTVPDMVRESALAIARYFLAADQADDRIEKDYKQALVWLKEIREGQMDVGLDSADTATVASSGGPQFTEGSGAFPSEALEAYGRRR